MMFDLRIISGHLDPAKLLLAIPFVVSVKEKLKCWWYWQCSIPNALFTRMALIAASLSLEVFWPHSRSPRQTKCAQQFHAIANVAEAPLSLFRNSQAIAPTPLPWPRLQLSRIYSLASRKSSSLYQHSRDWEYSLSFDLWNKHIKSWWVQRSLRMLTKRWTFQNNTHGQNINISKGLQFMPCFLNSAKPSLLHKLKVLKTPVLEVSHIHTVYNVWGKHGWMESWGVRSTLPHPTLYTVLEHHPVGALELPCSQQKVNMCLFYLHIPVVLYFIHCFLHCLPSPFHELPS